MTCAAKMARERVKSVDDLAGLFFSAAETERKMPRAYDLRVRGYWPEVPADPHTAYGYGEVRVRPSPALAKEVSDYDLALLLTPMMELEAARLVWAAATTAAFRERGPNWKKVARHANIHPATAKRRFQDAMVTLWYRIALERPRMRPDAR